MVIEAFDSKQTKYKIGMECKISRDKVKNIKGLYYIVDMKLDSKDKLNSISLISKDLSSFVEIEFSDYPGGITLTGNYIPEFLKLKRSLAK